MHNGRRTGKDSRATEQTSVAASAVVNINHRWPEKLCIHDACKLCLDGRSFGHLVWIAVCQRGTEATECH